MGRAMSRRERSRSYPVLSLREAEEAVTRVGRELGSGAWDRDPVAQALGHAHGRGGTAARKVSALTQYGLLRRRNGRYSLSTLGEALVHPRDDAERRAALRQALARPAVFGELLERYAPRGLLPQALHHALVRDHGITAAASGAAAEIFRRSARHAGVVDAEGRWIGVLGPGAPAAKVPPSAEEIGDQSAGRGGDTAAATPARGDAEGKGMSDEATRPVAERREGPRTQRFEIALGGGRSALLVLPAEPTARDLALLRKQLELLELQAGIEG